MIKSNIRLEKKISLATDVIFDNMKESVIVMDAHKRIVTINKSAYVFFPNMEGDCPKREQIIQEGLIGSMYEEIPTWEKDCSFDFCDKRGETIMGWYEIRIKRVESDGELLGWVMFIFNETETVSLMHQLENWAFTDTLTGIPNRRFFIEQAQKEFAHLKREKIGMSLIIMDIDKFKKVNDMYGHQAGDEVLWQLAELVKSTVRPYDLFARFGGEEFIILAKDVTSEEGIGMAERIRQCVESAVFEWHEHKLAVTISIGVAAVLNETCTLDQAIFHADMKLLEAKESGRNNVKYTQIL